MVVHSRTIGYLLNSLTGLEAIRVRAARIAALQQAYVAALPRELAHSSRVGYETQGTLVLLAANSAVAARLRHLGPRLLLTIRKQFMEVKTIRVEVQLVRGNRNARRTMRRIGATGVQSLSALEAKLENGPLRSALQRLICRDTESGPSPAGEHSNDRCDPSDRDN